ncbi:uncharacterized protein KY384_008616 [Bacidia gigantensis]|uniref:uncharacterized protein n=1 Tax=Bacidia gigantensis TaxID=2732470 RepID=UPI001D050D10|nr:uncharacterized protein KY384_008616 [Bacidia gigantensis]KAG8527186.1 hypothetical protein KY384_008616 [Bacidia gigantensis]
MTTKAPEPANSEPKSSSSPPNVVVMVRLDTHTEEGRLRSFWVSESQLCDVSPVFKAAFQGRFLESREKSYRLEDTSPSTAACLVNWICTRKSFLHETTENRNWQEYYLQLAHLYVCASEYLILDLVDLLEANFICSLRTNLIMRQPNFHPGSLCVDVIYGNTPPSAKLRKILTAFYAAHAPSPGIYADANLRAIMTDCPDFRDDVAAALEKRKRDPYKQRKRGPVTKQYQNDA